MTNLLFFVLAIFLLTVRRKRCHQTHKPVHWCVRDLGFDPITDFSIQLQFTLSTLSYVFMKFIFVFIGLGSTNTEGIFLKTSLSKNGILSCSFVNYFRMGIKTSTKRNINSTDHEPIRIIGPQRRTCRDRKTQSYIH